MKILIADDDADDRALAYTALQEVNKQLKVEFAKDGQELMDKLIKAGSSREVLPDVLLLDLNMPRKDGRAALKEIMTNSKLKHLNVIIFSTSTSDVDKKYTLELGASQYIVKPSDYIELINIFNRINEGLMQL